MRPSAPRLKTSTAPRSPHLTSVCAVGATHGEGHRQTVRAHSCLCVAGSVLGFCNQIRLNKLICTASGFADWRRYITHSEWQNDYGGKKHKSERTLYKPLAFDCCAISFQPFETPVMSPQGYVYDILYDEYALLPHSDAVIETSFRSSRSTSATQ